MKITRYFTKAGHDPLEGIPFVPRTSRITKLDGTVVFEARDVLVPEGWSQVAVDILAQKYFRRKGIDAANNGEKDARQVFHRLAGCWRHWGEQHGYFDSARGRPGLLRRARLHAGQPDVRPQQPPVVQHGPALRLRHQRAGPGPQLRGSRRPAR